MKAKLIVEGKEFDIEIQDPELQKLVKPQKKTGYERRGEGQKFYCVYGDGTVDSGINADNNYFDVLYDTANYYSERTIAVNNARADKLMRQLRRFAVEHRNKKIEWNGANYNYGIRYGHGSNKLTVASEARGHNFGMIVFDSEEAANLAIEIFHDELIWYFTEYKDSL